MPKSLTKNPAEAAASFPEKDYTTAVEGGPKGPEQIGKGSKSQGLNDPTTGKKKKE